VCVILCIFVFLCDILLPSGVINDDDNRSFLFMKIIGVRYNYCTFNKENITSVFTT